tara:strand:+ start:752 stop:2185 length:1434 start_codon:yes stop_codon:yes gene_type:complete
MPKLFITILFFLYFQNIHSQIEVLNLPGNINNENSQINFFQLDSTTAYFTSITIKEYSSNIFRAKFNDNAWQVLNKSKFNTNNYSSGNIFIDKKTKNIFYNKCSLDMSSCNIYFINNSIEYSLSELNSEGFANSNNTQPCIAYFKNFKVLFFVSDRTGGYGLLDIWFSIIDEKGNFGSPINAGPIINNEFNQITPYYSPIDQRLYFSSDQENNNMGGFDIYFSEGSLNIWLNPVSFTEINTEFDEMYFTIFRDNAYFSSNQQQHSLDTCNNCCNNIFHFNLIKESKKDVMNNSLSANYLPLDLFFDNNSPNPEIYIDSLNFNISYKDLYVDFFKEYDNYILQSKGDSLVFDFFESSLKSGYNDLNKILELSLADLSQGMFVEFTIKGYSSPLASTDYNKKLSSIRIKSLLNYIFEYKRGVFAYYNNNFKFSVNQVSLGESENLDFISDNPQDLYNSVFSIGAMKSRKVSIIKVVSYR